MGARGRFDVEHKDSAATKPWWLRLGERVTSQDMHMKLERSEGWSLLETWKRAKQKPWPNETYLRILRG